ncbi:uncharacterized protein LOC122370949 [Amphibalanus amphitrite]|uniref:uncharacterized protein LOC122370949 n=1 Tax=Amphibalanus amphitrite TaxID=1232801 RepID=UPI001C91F748|nr:uncharacterized protein LOC122370949 [Amphibalanus amphitrite]
MWKSCFWVKFSLVFLIIFAQTASSKHHHHGSKNSKHHGSKLQKAILNTVMTILENYLEHVWDEAKDGIYHVVDAPLDNLGDVKDLFEAIKNRKNKKKPGKKQKPLSKYGAGIKDEIKFGLHEIIASPMDNLPALIYNDRVDPTAHPHWKMRSETGGAEP